MKVFVTGGYFDDSGVCVVWSLDLERGTHEVVLEWTPPDFLRVPGKGFAGGCIGADGFLYVAAHAAVVKIDPKQWKVLGVLHQPCMNDIHHVACIEDRIYIANTGLESVDVFSIKGDFLGSHALLPSWVNTRRMMGQDPTNWNDCLGVGWNPRARAPWNPAQESDNYHTAHRTIGSFHQHKVRDCFHINHVALHNESVLATCFRSGSLRDLTNHKTVFQKEGAYLHDGLIVGSSIWLSAIDGRLFELDRQTYCEKKILDVFDTGHVGWCRGLAHHKKGMLVGLTQVRTERMPRHRWADVSPDCSETGVLLINPQNGALIQRVDLTNQQRHSKIYSILIQEGRTS